MGVQNLFSAEDPATLNVLPSKLNLPIQILSREEILLILVDYRDAVEQVAGIDTLACSHVAGLNWVIEELQVVPTKPEYLLSSAGLILPTDPAIQAYSELTAGHAAGRLATGEIATNIQTNPIANAQSPSRNITIMSQGLVEQAIVEAGKWMPKTSPVAAHTPRLVEQMRQLRIVR